MARTERSITVGTDFTRGSDIAVARASVLAKSMGAKLQPDAEYDVVHSLEGKSPGESKGKSLRKLAHSNCAPCARARGWRRRARASTSSPATRGR